MRIILCLLGVMVVMMIAGCESAYQIDDPVLTMMDRSEGMVKRGAAIKQAERDAYDDPDRINALRRLVWERGYPLEHRIYAIDQLIAIDEADAKRYLGKTIVLIRSTETLEHLIDQSVQRNWTDFVPALVRSYSLRSRGVDDTQRPERKAIEQLTRGQPLEQVILEVFAEDAEANIKQRVAAWSLLYRIYDDQQRLLEMLRSVDAQDPLVIDLRAAAMDLSIVPHQMETVTWLQKLRADHPQFWRDAKAVVAGLDDAQKKNLQLRHLPVLVALRKQQSPLLSESREALDAYLQQWDRSQTHHLKGPNYDGPMEEHPQRYRYWREKLSWGDLVVLLAARQWMGQRRMTEAWFALADQDLRDESTEFGGLVRWDASAGAAYVHAYPPLYRRHDLKYIPPNEVITDGYTALAHFHNHAQEYKNRRYAGPGIGDMKTIATTQQFTGIVLTFISESELNVDLYFDPQVVVDMGTIHRAVSPMK